MTYITMTSQAHLRIKQIKTVQIDMCVVVFIDSYAATFLMKNTLSYRASFSFDNKFFVWFLIFDYCHFDVSFLTV